MLKGFKEFALKGNVMDLAVGIIIGAAFGKIVSSLVESVIMPLIGILVGGVDFSLLEFTVKGVPIGIGVFIQSIMDFTIVAFAIFLFINMIIKFQKKEEEKPAEAPAPSNEEILLTEIRDLLKEKAI